MVEPVAKSIDAGANKAAANTPASKMPINPTFAAIQMFRAERGGHREALIEGIEELAKRAGSAERKSAPAREALALILMKSNPDGECFKEALADIRTSLADGKLGWKTDGIGDMLNLVRNALSADGTRDNAQRLLAINESIKIFEFIEKAPADELIDAAIGHDAAGRNEDMRACVSALMLKARNEVSLKALEALFGIAERANEKSAVFCQVLAALVSLASGFDLPFAIDIARLEKNRFRVKAMDSTFVYESFEDAIGFAISYGEITKNAEKYRAMACPDIGKRAEPIISDKSINYVIHGLDRMAKYYAHDEDYQRVGDIKKAISMFKEYMRIEDAHILSSHATGLYESLGADSPGVTAFKRALYAAEVEEEYMAIPKRAVEQIKDTINAVLFELPKDEYGAQDALTNLIGKRDKKGSLDELPTAGTGEHMLVVMTLLEKESLSAACEVANDAGLELAKSEIENAPWTSVRSLSPKTQQKLLETLAGIEKEIPQAIARDEQKRLMVTETIDEIVQGRAGAW